MGFWRGSASSTGVQRAPYQFQPSGHPLSPDGHDDSSGIYRAIQPLKF